MKSIRSPLVKVPALAPTDVTGFDEIIGGGLARGRTWISMVWVASSSLAPA